MSVKYAVLGLLAQRRGYGYDLVQRFQEQVGPGWELHAGAIYVALDKLEQDGLVRPLPTKDGVTPARRRTVRGAPRVVYEVTERGLERFETWMAATTAMTPFREELHLKLALSRPRDLPRLIELAREQERTCLERLAERAGERTADDLVASGQPWAEVASQLLREAEVAHLRATVDWLRGICAAMELAADRSAALEAPRG